MARAPWQRSLDRYASDQVAARRYTDDSAQWSAGLQVSHFARHGVAEWMDGRDAVDRLPPAQRGSALRALRRRFIRAGQWEVPRVFVGERGRAAVLELRDTRGRARVRLVVDRPTSPGSSSSTTAGTSRDACRSGDPPPNPAAAGRRPAVGPRGPGRTGSRSHLGASSGRLVRARGTG